VVGGVIGERRILFDLWGETVNTASRMESSGVPGRIQVAPSTHALLRHAFSFEERDDVEVKGLGPMTTYLLVR
jgi:class 3 adenylate cyclase